MGYVRSVADHLSLTSLKNDGFTHTDWFLVLTIDVLNGLKNANKLFRMCPFLLLNSFFLTNNCTQHSDRWKNASATDDKASDT